MLGSIYEKGKPNTNITSLFFTASLKLAGVGEKTYIKLDDREEYISSWNMQEKTKRQKNKGKGTGETERPRVNHSSDKLSIFPAFSKFEGDTSSQRLLFDNSPLQ